MLITMPLGRLLLLLAIVYGLGMATMLGGSP